MTVSPSTVNATISPRLASGGGNRSMSPLYGARSSPSTMPAMNTARKPEPWAPWPPVEDERGGQHQQRIERLAGRERGV